MKNSHAKVKAAIIYDTQVGGCFSSRTSRTTCWHNAFPIKCKSREAYKFLVASSKGDSSMIIRCGFMEHGSTMLVVRTDSDSFWGCVEQNLSIHTWVWYPLQILEHCLNCTNRQAPLCWMWYYVCLQLLLIQIYVVPGGAINFDEQEMEKWAEWAAQACVTSHVSPFLPFLFTVYCATRYSADSDYWISGSSICDQNSYIVSPLLAKIVVHSSTI